MTCGPTHAGASHSPEVWPWVAAGFPQPGSDRGLGGVSTPTCVPLVVAAAPGEVYGERTEEIKQGPGQDNDVVEVQQYDDDLRGVANSCRKRAPKASDPRARGWEQESPWEVLTQHFHLLLCILTALPDEGQWGGCQSHHPLSKAHHAASAVVQAGVLGTPLPSAPLQPSRVKGWQWEGVWAGDGQLMVGKPPKETETYVSVPPAE